MQNIDNANAIAYAPAQKQSLYHILQQHILVMQELEDNGGELSPELEQSLALTAENFTEKAESIANVIRHMENEEMLLEREIERLGERLTRKEAARLTLEKRLTDASTLLGIPRVKGKYLDIIFRKSQAVQITDENVIPDKYKNTKPVTTVSKALIKEAIQAGQDVPGAKLVESKTLQIK